MAVVALKSTTCFSLGISSVGRKIYNSGSQALNYAKFPQKQKNKETLSEPQGKDGCIGSNIRYTEKQGGSDDKDTTSNPGQEKLSLLEQ